jgi:hypothetical protein
MQFGCDGVPVVQSETGHPRKLLADELAIALECCPQILVRFGRIIECLQKLSIGSGRDVDGCIVVTTNDVLGRGFEQRDRELFECQTLLPSRSGKEFLLLCREFQHQSLLARDNAHIRPQSRSPASLPCS